MKKHSLKMGAILLSVAFIATSLAGCKKSEEAQAQNNVQNTQQENFKYPLKTDVKLTYWLRLAGNLNTIVKNQGETPFSQNLQKRTGVKIEYIHPPIGQENEAFNILLASGDLPDIIETDWTSFPGGPNKAISDGYIIKLNDAISKNANNLTKYLKSNPQIDKLVKTDSGDYYVFPFIRGAQKLLVASGYMVREDWLNDLSLQLPETIDEWHTVLKAFKDKKGALAPLTINLDNLEKFSCGFGIYTGFYQEEGKVKYGPIDPKWKQLLLTLKNWYDEGLIDKNFATIDGKTIDANILGSKSGATFGPGGGGLGKYMNSMAGKDSNFSLTGTKYPSSQKGVNSKFGDMDSYFPKYSSAAITSACKHVDIAARLLDYGYSEEGKLFFNFGEEGESYKMVNEYPTLTDLIMNNPDKLTVAQALSKYALSSVAGPFIQDQRYIEQYYALKQQKEGLARWVQQDTEKYMLPPLTPSKEESSEMSRIMSDIGTYKKELTIKFIMGIEPIDNFDKYIDQMNKLGIQKAISINQAALERFNKR